MALITAVSLQGYTLSLSAFEYLDPDIFSARELDSDWVIFGFEPLKWSFCSTLGAIDLLED